MDIMLKDTRFHAACTVAVGEPSVCCCAHGSLLFGLGAMVIELSTYHPRTRQAYPELMSSRGQA